MSSAVICDRCGLVMDQRMNADFHIIWLTDPYFFDAGSKDGNYQVHFCPSCYGIFEDEYLGNLKETYEQA